MISLKKGLPMINKIKSYLLLATVMLTFGAPLVVPIAVSACSNIATQVSSGANDAAGSGSDISCSTAPGTSGTDAIASLATQIVNIFSIVVVAAAVIMIIYSGFRYVTSGGDSGRVGGAKNSLIYAIIGLVIVALAQLIVHYVLYNAGQVTS
jgi:hypothetical protein